jgi:hypothetical protein
LQSLLEREIPVLDQLVKHLLIILEAMPLIRQAFNLLRLPNLIRNIDDTKDKLQDNVGLGLLRNDVELDGGIDTVIHSEEEHWNNDIEDDVEEH